ncbi:MAG: beta-lactamase family protein [Acidimicrobiales bacterium]|nr:beta-lactamase family protein [Acidimicrobiales bacterium]
MEEIVISDDPRLDQAKVDAFLARARREVDEGLLPAAAVAVALDGEVVIEASFGVGLDARFVGFSTTKALIAGAIWRLIDSGELDLEAPACKYIPEFASNGKDVVTIENLLTHTGGFPWAPLGPGKCETLELRRQGYGRWRLTAEVGTSFVYHPVAGHWVLADIAGIITGMTHTDAIEELVTRPLGLPRLLGIAVQDQANIGDCIGVGEVPTPDEMEATFGIRIDISEVLPPDVALNALLTLNDPTARELGVPGGGGIYHARDLALLYQGFMRNPGGLWSDEILQEGTQRVRMNLPDMMGIPASRSLGLVVAGDDGFGGSRGFGRVASPRSFGHPGAGGQIAFGDPVSGLSMAYLTSGLDQHIIRQSKRDIAIASLGADVLVSS